MKIIKTVAVAGTVGVLLTGCGSDKKDNAHKAPSAPVAASKATSTTPSFKSTLPPSASSTSGASATSGTATSNGSNPAASSGSNSASSNGSATSGSGSSSSASSSAGSNAGSNTVATAPAKITLTGADLGSSSCTIRPGTSTKSPSFTIKSVKATMTKDSSTYIIQFSKNYDNNLFSNEAKSEGASSYGIRLVSSNSDNLLYSFKSNKAFKLITQGNDKGKQIEVPQVKLEKSGNNLKITVPQKNFTISNKSWGAEEFFYKDSSNIALSSCEKSAN